MENALAAYYAETARRDHWPIRDRLPGGPGPGPDPLCKGLTTFLDVLVIEASLYEAQQAVSQSEATLRESLVSLYKALGGGWKAASRTTAPGTRPKARGKNGPSGRI